MPRLKRYRVQWGDHVQHVEAADEDQAFMVFQNQVGARVPEVRSNPDANQRQVEDLGYVDDPRKKRYRVTWGDMTSEVEAINEVDAWAQFSGGHEFVHPEIRRNPGLYPRIIEDLGYADEQDEREPFAASSAAGADAGDTTVFKSDIGLEAPGGLGGTSGGQAKKGGKT